MIKTERNAVNKWEFYSHFPTVSAFNKHLEENKYQPKQFKMFCYDCGTRLSAVIQAVEGNDYLTCTSPACGKKYKVKDIAHTKPCPACHLSDGSRNRSNIVDCDRCKGKGRINKGE